MERYPQITIIILCIFFYVLFGVFSLLNFLIMKRIISADQTKNLLTSQELIVVKCNYYLNIVNLSLNVISVISLLIIMYTGNTFSVITVICNITIFLNFIVPFIFEILIYGKHVLHKSKKLVKKWEANFIKFYNIIIGVVVLSFFLVIFPSILRILFISLNHPRHN